MTQPFDTEERKVRELEQDRERVDSLLRKPLPPTMEDMLRRERKWIAKQQRALERRPVACYAVLHVDGHGSTVRVRNVSAIGAGLELAAPPPVGARVQIEFPSLLGHPTLDGIVRHSSMEERRAGVEFVGGGEAARKVSENLVRFFGSAVPD